MIEVLRTSALSLIFVAFGATLCVLFWLRHKDRESRLSFDALLLNPDGTIDKPAIIAYFGVVVGGYVVLLYATRGTLSDAVFGLFMTGIVVPAVAAMFRKSGATAPADPIPPARPADPPNINQ